MAVSSSSTVKSIAAAAGLSPVTVSRILVGKTKGLRRDAVERAKLVESLAADMGYRPSAAARSMRTQRTRTVGLMITTNNPDRQPAYLTHQYETILGIEEVLAPLDHSLTVLRMHDVADDSAKLPLVFREKILDGMIVLGDTPDRVIDRVRETMPACVLVDTNRLYAEGCVRRDEQGAGRLVAEQAIAAGYTRLIYLQGFSEHFSVRDRLAGVLLAADSAGVPSPEIIHVDRGLSRPIFERVMGMITPGTAVLSYGVAYASRLAHLSGSHGLVPGRDYGLAAAEELVLDALSWPELARVRNDRWEMGAIAARMLMHRLELGAFDGGSVRVAGEWVPGATLARHRPRPLE